MKIKNIALLLTKSVQMKTASDRQLCATVSHNTTLRYIPFSADVDAVESSGSGP